MIEDVPHIFEASFQCTLEVRTYDAFVVKLSSIKMYTQFMGIFIIAMKLCE